jgi:hypothetical protein
MPRPTRPTPELEQTIAAYIRAGGYPYVAAEAAGVSPEVFDDWLQRGAKPHAAPVYRRFADAVRQAHAQSRLKAEIEALKKRPLEWLKSGPGKESLVRPGWSAAVRAQPGDAEPPNPLLDPRLQELLRALRDLLEPYPEVRDAFLQILEKLDAPLPAGGA